MENLHEITLHVNVLALADSNAEPMDHNLSLLRPRIVVRGFKHLFGDQTSGYLLVRPLKG